MANADRGSATATTSDEVKPRYDSIMNTSANCPDESKIKAMLSGRVDDGELSDLARHVSQCERCQQSYEQHAKSLALPDAGDPGDELEESVVPELCDLMEALKAEAGTTAAAAQTLPLNQSSPTTAAWGEVDLSFLRPSNTPGSRGRLGIYEITDVVGQRGDGAGTQRTRFSIESLRGDQSFASTVVFQCHIEEAFLARSAGWRRGQPRSRRHHSCGG